MRFQGTIKYLAYVRLYSIFGKQGLIRYINVAFSQYFAMHTYISDSAHNIGALTHISLASHWDIGKQCRPRSDAAERGV